MFSSEHFQRKFRSRATITPYDQSFEQPPFRKWLEAKYHDDLIMLSSGPIKNEVLTINSEHPSSEDHFEK